MPWQKVIFVEVFVSFQLSKHCQGKRNILLPRAVTAAGIQEELAGKDRSNQTPEPQAGRSLLSPSHSRSLLHSRDFSYPKDCPKRCKFQSRGGLSKKTTPFFPKHTAEKPDPKKALSVPS